MVRKEREKKDRPKKDLPDRAPTSGAGLDIDLGNLCSKTAWSWAKKTFENRWNKTGMPCLGAEGSFSNLMEYGDLRIAMTSDGIGTKAELAERTGIYDTLGFDLVAMVADDLAASGIEPVNLSNILDVDRLDHGVVDQLMKGLAQAARQSGMAVVGGEIAELGSRISGWGVGMHFNWCATAIGLLPKGSKPIDGSLVQPEDRVISIRSRGFRSNGFSLLRRVLEERYGASWHVVPCDDRSSWGEVLLAPSLIYCPLVTALLRGGFSLHGIAHVTGGGIPDNLQRVLDARGLGAVLDDIHEPHSFMRAVQAMGDVPEEVAYRLWNMGNGMLLVVPVDEAKRLCKFAARKGYMARDSGRVIDQPSVIIESKGCQPQTLTYG